MLLHPATARREMLSLYEWIEFLHARWWAARNDTQNKSGVWIRQCREPLAWASGHVGFSIPEAVVASKAQALRTWGSHSSTAQTGRKAGRIYQTTNGQGIENILWLMPNDCAAGLRKIKCWTTKHHHLGPIKEVLLSTKTKQFWFVWSS